MENASFDALMGKAVLTITCAAGALLLALVTVFAVLFLRNTGRGAVTLLYLYPGIVCLLMVLAMPLLRIKGYVLGPDGLRVNLGYGSRVFSLEGLKAVRRCPDAFDGAIRTMGNGGLFSILGRFRSERLGAFRAYVSDPDRMVLLEWDNQRIVVSPADADRFIQLASKQVVHPG